MKTSHIFSKSYFIIITLIMNFFFKQRKITTQLFSNCLLVYFSSDFGFTFFRYLEAASVSILQKDFCKISQNLHEIFLLELSCKFGKILSEQFFSQALTRRYSLKKRSSKFYKFHRKVPVNESIFNDAAGLNTVFIKERIQHRYSY